MLLLLKNLPACSPGNRSGKKHWYAADLQRQLQLDAARAAIRLVEDIPRAEQRFFESLWKQLQQATGRKQRGIEAGRASWTLTLASFLALLVCFFRQQHTREHVDAHANICTLLLSSPQSSSPSRNLQGRPAMQQVVATMRRHGQQHNRGCSFGGIVFHDLQPHHRFEALRSTRLLLTRLVTTSRFSTVVVGQRR